MTRGRDDGRVLLLAVVYALVVAGLVTVVIDVSAVVLAREAVVAEVDGAAVAAAQEVDAGAFYTSSAPSRLALSQPLAASRVGEYLTEQPVPAGVADLAVTDVGVAADTVTVAATALVRLPVLGLVPSPWHAGVPVHVTANARAPFRGG